jgi:hypothetical protein
MSFRVAPLYPLQAALQFDSMFRLPVWIKLPAADAPEHPGGIQL